MAAPMSRNDPAATGTTRGGRSLRSLRTITALAVSAGLLVGGLASAPESARADVPSPSASPSPSTSPSASPTPTATSSASVPAPARQDPNLSPNLVLDNRATLSADLATGVVSVRFRSSAVKRRPVSLQRWRNGAWSQVAKSRLSGSGRVTFHVGSYQPGYLYRAVELSVRIKKKLAPVRATKSYGWNQTFSDSFTSKQLDAEKWLNVATGARGPRWCSQPLPQMVSLSNGSLVGAFSYEKDAVVAAEIESGARRAQEREGLPVVGCENGSVAGQRGVFRTSIISTRNRAVVNTSQPGMVAARVKMPEAQGMHGAVWLQTVNKGEVDVIEGFGYGRGISNMIHSPSPVTLDAVAVGRGRTNLGSYVSKSSTKNRSWWKKYHTYSMAWDSKGFTFRVDGSVTQRVKIRPGDVDYYLVLSLLVSDWEAELITKPVKKKGFKSVTRAKLPQQMRVDWVRVWTKA